MDGCRFGSGTGAVAATQEVAPAGRKSGHRCFPVCGPMFFLRLLCLLILPLPAAFAQDAPPAAAPAGAPAGAPAEGSAAGAPATPPARKPVPPWRDTSNYVFPAIAKTVADMQNLAYAMTLRDYCADRRVPDEFVQDRLKRFSALTGREETCRSLMDY